MIKPTVGRMVYYKSYGTPNGEYKPEDRAAIITGVVDDETVHLCVFNPTGLFLNQNVKRGDQGGQWDWMPYQKGQAAKTEELETMMAKAICDAVEPLKIGDAVKYVDHEGISYPAEVTQVWSQECVNLKHVDFDNKLGPIPTSVPSKRAGMTGFYFERLSKI